MLLAPKENPGVWAAGAGVPNGVAEIDAPKLNPPEAGGAGVLGAGFWVAVDTLPKVNVGAGAGREATVCVEAPKTGAAEGVVVFPKEKPAPPNVGWLLVPNAGAAVLAAAPNINGAVPLLPPPAPNGKGFGAAGVCCVDAGKVDDAVKVELPKVVCVVGISEDVVVLLVMPNPPNGVDVEFWFADSWPKVNVLWAWGAGAGFAAPNWKAEVVPLALTVLVFSLGATVVVNVAPNWNVVFVAGADVVVAVQLPNRDWEGVCVVGAADDVDTVAGWVLVNPPNNIPLFCEAGAAGVDVIGVAVCPKALMPLPVPNNGLKVDWVSLTSAVEAGVVLAAPKMGLNPDDRGLLMLLTDATVVIGAATVDLGGSDAGVATGLIKLNRLPPPPRAGLLDVGWRGWARIWAKAEGMEVAGLEAGVDMEDGVENEGCRVVGPNSDLTTPLLGFVGATAGVERLDTDTAGAV